MLKTVERITELEINFLSIISWIFSTKTVSSCQSCGWRPKNQKKQVLQSLMHACMDLFSEDTCPQQIGCGWTWRLSDGWGLVNSRLYREPQCKAFSSFSFLDTVYRCIQYKHAHTGVIRLRVGKYTLDWLIPMRKQESLNHHHFAMRIAVMFRGRQTHLDVSSKCF